MYEERPSPLVPGAIVWRRTGAPGGLVLPDGCMDLLWVGGRLLVAGPDTGPHPAGEVQGGARGLVSGVRFAPGTAPALLGVPAHELRDRRVELADLWPEPEVRALAERMSAYEDPGAGLERLARSRAGRSAPHDPLASRVAAGLRSGESVAAVAAVVGLGPRQLHRRSLDAFGYGPRTLGRVLRLQRALELARRGLPQAEVAHRAGYADQAHLAREFRALAGTTPGAYAAAYAPAGAAAPAGGPAGGSAAAKRETAQPSGSSTAA
ncbi:helix-turn-helix domain-containing protein [Streptomyces vinaceus]|uniref:helix-turn-helix domain-containing protein n=1 Tax=Streptomyces vinaceus TaxID=1960 RepID=UPI003808F679